MIRNKYTLCLISINYSHYYAAHGANDVANAGPKRHCSTYEATNGRGKSGYTVLGYVNSA